MKPILPTPKSYELLEGKLSLSPAVLAKDERFAPLAGVFAQAFEKIKDLPLAHDAGGVTLEYDPSLPAAHYVCDFSETMRLLASDIDGMRSAVATALQLISTENGSITADRLCIKDYPDKDFRTLMVDLSRVWHPFWTLKHYVDVCFFLKLKYLHLHLIDDQGYRLPSRAFPKIATPKYHYTQEQIAELNAYAKERGIVLIPEIEGPGHARSLNQSYSAVFGNRLDECEIEQLITENGDIVQNDSLLCAGKPETMEGLRTIVREVCEMFPDSPYIHIGGDEASIKVWNYCTECRRYMKENGIEDVYDLYSDFVGRFAQLVIDEGRTPIVWEGFPKKGSHRIPRKTIVIAWESHYHMAYDLLDEGFTIINGSWQPLYIVPGVSRQWGPREILDWDVYNLQHWWPKSEAHLNPIHLTPTDDVWGAQISMWETSYEDAIARVMQNCAALSERLWSVRRTQEYDAYRRAWDRSTLPRLRLLIRED